MHFRTWLLLTLIFTAVCLSGCSSAQTKKVHSIDANFVVPVIDPVLRQLTTATEHVDLSASGDFSPGIYTVHGTEITVDPDTSFRFSVKLPIADPKVIDIGGASGELQTSKPLRAAGLSLPEKMILQDGKMSGEVDLIRTMGSFFFNILQVHGLSESEGAAMHDMVSKMVINNAELRLRPDSMLHVGPHRLHIGKDSSIKLANLVVDKGLDYKGSCLIDVNFAQDSQYTGEKVDTTFNGGLIRNTLAVQRVNDTLTLSLIPNQPLPKITLKDCVYKFGRQKTSSAHCTTSLITLKTFDWSDNQKDLKKPAFHAFADMSLSDTRLALRYPTYTVDAVFPETEPATMEMFRDDSGHGFDFKTHEILARTGDIDIIRPSTNLDIKLTNARLGSIELTKSGELNFSLSQGTAGLTALEWSNEKKTFRLLAGGASTLSITRGASMSMFKDHPGAPMLATIPLSMTVAHGTLSNARGALLDLSKLNGKIVVKVDKEVIIEGTADFSMTGSKFLGNHNADVKVRGFRLAPRAGVAVASLKDCSLVVPRRFVEEEIRKQMPDEKSFDLNQEILPEKTWRYKEGMLTKLTVRKPTVSDFTFSGTNKATFNICGDVELDGTVEKTGILSVFKKDPKHWQTRPWSASAPCSGTGAVTYKMVANDSAANSSLEYDLQLKMPLPDNIDVDWSGVSKGLVRKAETTAICKYLRKCTPFHGSRFFPMDRKGAFKLFDDPDPLLKSMRISKFATKPCDSGTQINFVGEASL